MPLMLCFLSPMPSVGLQIALVTVGTVFGLGFLGMNSALFNSSMTKYAMEGHWLYSQHGVQRMQVICQASTGQHHAAPA